MRKTMCLVLALVAACDDEVQPPSDRADARTCDQTSPGMRSNACDWDWTCSDHSGVTPQYALHCESADGVTFACTCKIGVVETGTITLPDACSSTTDICAMANAGCGWQPLIDCLP